MTRFEWNGGAGTGSAARTVPTDAGNTRRRPSPPVASNSDDEPPPSPCIPHLAPYDLVIVEHTSVISNVPRGRHNRIRHFSAIEHDCPQAVHASITSNSRMSIFAQHTGRRPAAIEPNWRKNRRSKPFLKRSDWPQTPASAMNQKHSSRDSWSLFGATAPCGEYPPRPFPGQGRQSWSCLSSPVPDAPWKRLQAWR